MPITLCNALAAGCDPDWEGIGAISTAFATITALGLPFLLARLQRIKENQARRAVIHEVCSIVDRIVAYHDVAVKLIGSEMIYFQQFEACDQITENSRLLKRALSLLIVRPELSDGALIAAAAAEPVAESLTLALASTQGLSVAEQEKRRAILSSASLSAKIGYDRSRRVRSYFGLSDSESGENIRKKYNAIIEACLIARQTNKAPEIGDISDSPY